MAGNATGDEMIGRRNEAHAVLNELRSDPQVAKRLTAIYGLGGVGKSTFISHVRERMPSHSVFATLDENFSPLRDGRQVLAELSRQARSRGVVADKFQETLTRLEDILERLIGSDSTAAGRIGHLLGLGAKAAADTVTGGPVSEIASEILEPFAIRANAAWQRVRAADRIAHADRERELLDDPLGLLTSAFFADIDDWIEKSGGQFVLVVDTFEVTSRDIVGFLLDRVLPVVLKNGANIRLLVSGRFPLSHYDPRWIDRYGVTVLQVQILPFTVAEVELYLEKRVRPHSTRPLPSAEELHAATAGLPFLLERWRVSGMSAAEISSTGRSTFDRLTRWLSDEERDWLCQACCPSAFDAGLLRHILGSKAESAFAFLSRDESICERISSECFSVLEPLRMPGLDALKETGRLGSIVSAVLAYVATELKGQTELLLGNSAVDDGRIKWLITELTSASSLDGGSALAEPLVDDLCLIAAVEPVLLVESLPADLPTNARKGRASKAASVVRVLNSIVNGQAAPGLRFARTFFASPEASVGLQLLSAVAQRRAGNLRRALTNADAAVQIRASPRTFLERATIRMLLGRFKQATDDLDSSLAINPTDGLCWATRGEVQRQQGKFGDACFSFAMALENGSVPDYVHAEYADALAQTRKFDPARDQAEFACLLSPDDSWNLSIRAYVATLAGDATTAAEYFARALDVAPEDYSKACVYALKGERDLAISFLETALMKGIRSRSWARYDPDFRSLRADPDFVRLTRLR